MEKVFNSFFHNQAIIYKGKQMEKQSQCRWKKVCTRKSTGQTPVPRWGHTCCVIQDEIVFFGGYADSNYMNDMWSFNATTMEWREVRTTGDVPQNRSNCSMNYDSQNNRIIVFGGGGSSKKRFNTLSILNWETKEWLEIKPREDEPAPWERTYHSAEFCFPYLVVFGGEGIADLDDLWLFNFLTLSWKEVQIPKNKPKPCARRFHSSAMIKNEMVIIGGCHSRYRSLNDVFTLDLKPLLETGDTSKLEWKQRKLEGATFLTRWGHTSTVLGDKIYVFGGRFSNDLNDLLAIDLQAGQIRNVKGALDAPIPRRRHCAAFMGSSLLVFGGFNGEYFNDLHYITLQDSRNWVSRSQIVGRLTQMVDNPLFSDSKIQLVGGETVHLHRSLMLPAFKHWQLAVNDFISYLKTLDKPRVLDLLKMVYVGMNESNRTDLLLPQFDTRIESHDRVDARSYYSMIRNRLKGNQLEINSLIVPNEASGTIKFKDSDWEELFASGTPFADVEIKTHGSAYRFSKSILSLNSEYFSNLLSGDFADGDCVEITHISERVIRVMLKYLQFELALIPDTFSQKEWVELLQVSKYYSLERLTSICQYQLSLTISSDALPVTLTFAVRHGLENLKNFCAEQQIRKIQRASSSITYDEYEKAESKCRSERQLQQLKNRFFKMLYFEIQQSRLERSRLLDLKNFEKEPQLRREESEKENSEINS